ncbi:MAG: phosphatase [Negativicutes bacterium]
MNLIADLHTHTLACGHAYGTIMENVKFAKERGLKYCAITDHGVRIPGGPHPYYFGNIKAIPAFLDGVRILRGAECNILDEYGKLDLSPDMLARLDIVLAGFHVPVSPFGSPEKNTATLAAAMENPYLDILVHTGNPEFPIIPELLVNAARERGVALEINNASLTLTRHGSRPVCVQIVELCRDRGVTVSLGSDAHFPTLVGEVSAGIELLNECNYPLERVLNFNEKLLIAHLNRNFARGV